ncbi:hypothetical protein BS47DRAFT_1487465 [Hydnum rufescens UP504]|uniref:N-alpha-acetyltransferase 40 n=1 Tax=Hydnum rufescens UP504 TaxID=1448309 RepID=A0A9P6DPV1_9AGAM|nr:hypothetical protein BS47DRAFT_1487465 [Hydnum rufescens UP504]
MFHHDARFLIASHLENQHPPDSPVAGFATFRFEVEPDMEDEDEPVAYLYELHVSPQSKQKGVGSLLLRGVEAIGSHWSMKKVMLTVLTVNVNAIKFYARLDYTIDPTSWIASHPLITTAPRSEAPAEDDEQDPLGPEDRDIDYLILSKILPSSTNSA